MKIFGVGTDIIKVSRIEKFLNNKKSLQRLFNKDEIFYCKKKKNFINCFAKRFAAKEALFKAVGIPNKLQFNDVEIKNNRSGLPNFYIKGSSLKNLKKIFKNKRYKIHLSLSDDEPWAVATAIIFTNK